MLRLKQSIILLLLVGSCCSWAGQFSLPFCGHVQSLVYQKVEGQQIESKFIVSNAFEERSVHISDLVLTQALLADVLDAANEPIEQMYAPTFFKTIARFANVLRVHICFQGLTIEEKEVDGAIIEAGYIEEDSEVKITTL